MALGLLGIMLMVEGACRASFVTGAPPAGFLTHPEASLALLKARLPALMDSGGVPGMSVALISGGRVLWMGGLGVRNAGTAGLARIALERVAVEKGAAFALEEYTRMRRTHPPDTFREGLLNSLGYRMLQLGRPADAVILFEHNTREYPESANVFDSLGDGLAAAGARDAAIGAYERSLRLDPTNSHAATAIEELRRQP